MNFLAHFLLSYPSQPLVTGNFLADFIKGKKYLNYPEEVQKGIIMHRKIDTFTDAHPIVKQSTARIRSEQGKFSPVVIDMFYDHFLAAQWQSFHPKADLAKFAEEIYALLDADYNLFPDKVKAFYPYMKNGNWLLRYATVQGVCTSLKGLYKRTGGISNMDKAEETLVAHYEAIKADFNAYFPLLQAYTQQL
jgi:acyl carrier protein phosphodiesterase